MTDIPTLWQTFGLAGLALGVLYSMFKAVWPFFRDVYYPRRAAAQEKLADAVHDIATLLGSVRQDVGEMKADVRDVRLDQTRLFGQLEIEQPSRPRSPASAAPGATPL